MRAVTLLLALLSVSCGSTTSADRPTSQLSVGGSYTTAVTLSENSCPGTVVETHPTTVSHVPGARTLSLTHAGTTYTGTIDSGGVFRTPATPYVFGATTYVMSIAGRFTTTTIDALVTVVPQVTPPCQFVARWVGPKSGSPNTIP